MTRRTIDEPRSCKTWTYLTRPELDRLQAFAATLDVTVSTVLRALVQKAIDDSPESIGSVTGVPSRAHLEAPRAGRMTPEDREANARNFDKATGRESGEPDRLTAEPEPGYMIRGSLTIIDREGHRSYNLPGAAIPPVPPLPWDPNPND